MTDAEIVRTLAERVMGWKSEHIVLNEGHEFYELSCEHGCKIWIIIIKDESDYLKESRHCWSPCWSPLTRWGHAGMVVDKIVGNNELWFEIHSPFLDDAEWWAGFTPMGTTGWNGRSDFTGHADTAPRAICLAALEAVALGSDG